jgi:hypothetical protein
MQPVSLPIIVYVALMLYTLLLRGALGRR